MTRPADPLADALRRAELSYEERERIASEQARVVTCLICLAGVSGFLLGRRWRRS